MNLSRMDAVTALRQEGGRFFVTVQPGVVLLNLRKMLQRREFDTAGWSEASQAALRREIAEELGVQIEVGELLHTVEWDYPAFHLSMQCFTCRAGQEPLQLREHAAARWLSADELDAVPWLPADVDLLPHVAALLKSVPC